MMNAARFDAKAGGPSPTGRCQAEGGRTPGPVPCGMPDFRLAGSGLRSVGAAAETEADIVPQHKDLKRLVRARMAETGENYTQALTALLRDTRLDPLPGGWLMAGSHPADYDAGLLPRACLYNGNRVMRLRFRAAVPPGGFGTVMQSIDAARYRGYRVRFSVVMRGREITDWAGAWLRVDAANGGIVLDNMQDRPLRGTTAWTEAANVLDVDDAAASVHFGVLLVGAGAVDLASPRFEVVDTDVPMTRIEMRPMASEPQGLDFGAS